MFLLIFVVLLVAWVLSWVTLHVTSALIHHRHQEIAAA